MSFQRVKIITDGTRVGTRVLLEDGSDLGAALESVSFNAPKDRRRHSCTVTFRDCVVEWSGDAPMPESWEVPG